MQMIVFENPADMGRLVFEFNSQLDGNSGSFILSDGDRELDLNKSVVFVVDPFVLDCNSKDILSGFYQEISQMIECGEGYGSFHSILGELMGTIMNVASMLEPDSDYIDLNVPSVLKGMSVGFLKSDSLSENLCDYARLVSRYTKKRLMVFVNVSGYFSDGDYADIIHYFKYLQFPILMIESKSKDVGIPLRLFDFDFCELDLV